MAGMTDHDPRTPSTSRWAPWWVYLVVLLGANYLRAAAIRGSDPMLHVVTALGLAAILFLAVTALWRASR